MQQNPSNFCACSCADRRSESSEGIKALKQGFWTRVDNQRACCCNMERSKPQLGQGLLWRNWNVSDLVHGETLFAFRTFEGLVSAFGWYESASLQIAGDTGAQSACTSLRKVEVP